MSVIIRLQNLPWSANALDIRNFFRGLSIPEGGVHIVGGELGDAFIAFSTDEDARQAMMNDGGKLKEIQVKLLLSSRSEMHKVIEAARQSVPLLSLQPQTIPQPATIPAPVTAAQVIPPFAASMGNANMLGNIPIPGVINTHEIPQPAVIEPPPPIITSPVIVELRDNEKSRSRDRDSKERRRSRSRSRSKSRERKERIRKRDRSRSRDRSRDRRRRDRSRDRSRDRRDRRRDRKDRSRSRDRSPRRSRGDRLIDDYKLSPQHEMIDKKKVYGSNNEGVVMSTTPSQNNFAPLMNGPFNPTQSRFQADNDMEDTFNRLQEIGKKRNPNAFQGENNTNGGRLRNSCCVAIKNAPNHTSYGDVRRFFPFLIDKHGIKMINDSTGRRTGTIYVRFCEQRSRQIVLDRPNNELKGAQVVVEPLSDDAYTAAIDSFLPYRNDNDNDVTEVIAEEVSDTYTVLKVSDLPYFAKELDIMKLFGDFSLLCIIINDCRTTRTRNAFVQFAKHADAEMAYSRKGSYSLGRKHISITIASEAEFEEEKAKQTAIPEPTIADDSQNNDDRNSPRDPRQRRAVPAAAAQEVPPPVVQLNNPTGNYFNTRFQQGFPAAGYQNNQYGAAFPQNGVPAAANLDPRNNWGPRAGFPPGPIQQSFRQQRPMHQPMPPQPIPPQQMPPLMAQPMPNMINDKEEILDCVLMKGLPQNCSDITIVEFLSEIRAVPARIHLMLDLQGVPSGDCFCEFRTPQEARRATSKHGCELNGSRITVDLVSRAVVDEALEGPKPDEKPENLMPQQPFYEPPPPPRRGFPPYRGRGGYDRGGYERGGRGYRRGYDRSGRGFEHRGRGRGSFGRGGPPLLQAPPNEHEGREDDPDSALDDFGAPGCVVCMENVPFRATVNDILVFFGDFDLTQDDVIRRFNERGQPTGDARVAFRTPFDALRAVSTRNLAPILERKISLTIAL